MPQVFQGGFNANNYEPSDGTGGVLPAGIYDVQMVKSEVVPTKSGTGQMLVCQLAITAGNAVGRKITARFNVQNQNPQAVEIAMRELSAMSHVIGVPFWQDSTQLHGRPFKVNLGASPRDDDPTKVSNDILGYLDAWGNPPKPANGGAPSQGQQGQVAPPQSQPQSYPQGPQTGAFPQGTQNYQPQGAPQMPQGGPQLQGAPQPMGQPQGMPQGGPQWTPGMDAGSTMTSGQGPAPVNQGPVGYGGQTAPMPGAAQPQGQYQPPQGPQGMQPQGMPQPQNGGVAVPGSNQQQPSWNGPQSPQGAPSWA